MTALKMTALKMTALKLTALTVTVLTITVLTVAVRAVTVLKPWYRAGAGRRRRLVTPSVGASTPRCSGCCLPVRGFAEGRASGHGEEAMAPGGRRAPPASHHGRSTDGGSTEETRLTDLGCPPQR